MVPRPSSRLELDAAFSSYLRHLSRLAFCGSLLGSPSLSFFFVSLSRFFCGWRFSSRLPGMSKSLSYPSVLSSRFVCTRGVFAPSLRRACTCSMSDCTASGRRTFSGDSLVRRVLNKVVLNCYLYFSLSLSLSLFHLSLL